MTRVKVTLTQHGCVTSSGRRRRAGDKEPHTVVRSMLLVLLASCHARCGDNAGAQYGYYIDPAAQCWTLHQGDEPSGDYAICKLGDETWLCDGAGPKCRPLGPPIRMERVR